jgi:hypothetical protein
MDTGTYRQHAALADLPPLVRQQRTLERQILPLALHAADEKAVRASIDALLIAAGLAKGEGVTCNGYDVTHIERAGTSRLNGDVLTEQLVAAGVDRVLVTTALSASTETGDPSAWATVKPSKGASVRAPSTSKRMAKATGLRPRTRAR